MGQRGTAHIARQGIWNGGKDVVCICLVLEGRRVIIGRLGGAGLYWLVGEETIFKETLKDHLDHRGGMCYEVLTRGVQFFSPERPGVTLGSFVLG